MPWMFGSVRNRCGPQLLMSGHTFGVLNAALSQTVTRLGNGVMMTYGGSIGHSCNGRYHALTSLKTGSAGCWATSWPAAAPASADAHPCGCIRACQAQRCVPFAGAVDLRPVLRMQDPPGAHPCRQIARSCQGARPCNA